MTAVDHADGRWRDEVAIRALVDRYADAVAEADEKSWRETWLPDGDGRGPCEWVVFGRAVRGRDEVVALWRTLMSGLTRAVQMPSAGVVEPDGDGMSGRWTVTEVAWLKGGQPLFTVGRYRDEYVRGEGGWLFRRRSFEALYTGPPDLSGPAPAP